MITSQIKDTIGYSLNYCSYWWICSWFCL